MKKISRANLARRMAIRERSFGQFCLDIGQQRTPLRSNAAQRRHCSIYLRLARSKGWLELQS
jgi:hypothetical protein